MNPALIGLIWAQADGGVIGKDGVMPWHVPEDLAHFKQITLGAPVIMGRKTWESLPPRFRPLPGRQNVVVTRTLDWAPDAGSEVSVAHTIDAALAAAAASRAAVSREKDTSEQPWIWVIGGAEIFAAVIEIAVRLEVTELRATIPGDTLAPPIDESWKLTASEPAQGWMSSRGGLDYRFLRYER